MSISPLPPKSNEPSRPASPAADALEVLSLDEEAISPGEEAIRMRANSNRKTSSWKGFKSSLTKAELKLKSFTKDRKAVDGTICSPTELSPDSVEESAQSSSPEDESTEKIADLIKNIEELGAECDREIFAKASNSCIPDKKDKKVDFAVEESPCRKSSVTPNEGAGISRPTELPFGGKNDVPTAPPRVKKDKRLERLLSVPNIKLNKQEQNRLLNLRKTSNVEKPSAPSTSSSAAASSSKSKGGNFMRRFSKYQFHCITQSIIILIADACVCMLFVVARDNNTLSEITN